MSATVAVMGTVVERRNPLRPVMKATILGGIACLASGDTLCLHAGTYTDEIYTDQPGHDIPNGTSYATATIIESYNGTVNWNFTGSSAIRFRNADQYIIMRAPVGTAFIIDGTNGQQPSGAFGITFSAVTAETGQFLGATVWHVKEN
jgi:hypothetical protein